MGLFPHQHAYMNLKLQSLISNYYNPLPTCILFYFKSLIKQLLVLFTSIISMNFKFFTITIFN